MRVFYYAAREGGVRAEGLKREGHTKLYSDQCTEEKTVLHRSASKQSRHEAGRNKAGTRASSMRIETKKGRYAAAIAAR